MIRGVWDKILNIEVSTGRALFISALLGFFWMWGLNILSQSRLEESYFELPFLQRLLFAETLSIVIFVGMGLLLNPNRKSKIIGGFILFMAVYQILWKIATIK